MSLDALLEQLDASSLTVTVDATCTPRLRGPRAAVAPDVLEALRQHRGEIIARFRPRPARREIRTIQIEQVRELGLDRLGLAAPGALLRIAPSAAARFTTVSTSGKYT